jgi:type I restriction enzyme S subunit
MSNPKPWSAGRASDRSVRSVGWDGSVGKACPAEDPLLEQRLAKTRALKQGMMQEFLTGRTRLV